MFYDAIEIVAAGIMLLYLWLEYRASIWLWPVGVVIPAFYIYIYYVNKFYADMGVNVYYLFASAYGWYRWQRGRGRETSEAEVAIRRTPRGTWLRLASAYILLQAALYLVLSRFTDSPVPWGDAFTTALSILAMWMLAQKYIEQWGVWMVVNAVSAALYFWKGMTPTAVTYVVYTIVPIFGYMRWRRMMGAAE